MGPPDASVRYTSPTTLASGETSPRAIAVDDSRLYWIDREDTLAGPGRVRSLLKGTTLVTSIATGEVAPLDIAVDELDVYWSVDTAAVGATSQCLVKRALKASVLGGSCFVNAAFSPIRMVLTSDDVVILAAAAAGGNPFLGYATKSGTGTYDDIQAQGQSAAIAATDTDVFVGNGGHVDAYSIAPLAVLAGLCGTACGDGTIVDMAVNTSGTVYWVTSHGDVVSGLFSTAGTQPSTPLGTVPASAQRLAFDANYVYVTSTEGGTISAVPTTSGGTILTLATGEDAPFGIAVDTYNVYWTCGDGTIRAVERPAE